MKLSATVLASLCALGTTGCEPIYMAPPVAPTQPVYQPATVEIDPRVETIEGIEFSQPPPSQPAVAPVRPRPVVRPVLIPQPQPQITNHDPCPACGMG